MPEPITLWDKYGTPVTTYSPSWAHAQIVTGLLFEQPPAKPVLTPDDTQEVPTVATGRARRKREQRTGVL